MNRRLIEKLVKNWVFIKNLTIPSSRNLLIEGLTVVICIGRSVVILSCILKQITVSLALLITQLRS